MPEIVELEPAVTEYGQPEAAEDMPSLSPVAAVQVYVRGDFSDVPGENQPGILPEHRVNFGVFALVAVISVKSIAHL